MAKDTPVLEDGYKWLNPEEPGEGQILESVHVGKDVVGLDGRYVGPDCVIGDNVKLNYGILGSAVYVGEASRVKADKVGDFTKIGAHTTIGEKCVIGDNVLIGDDVTIGDHVELREGVNIPDHWLIPPYNVVNRGSDGAPVVISTYLPHFRCNVMANNGGY